MPFNFKVDESYEYYLNNWYVDIMCAPAAQVSLMYSQYFIGRLAGGVLAVLPDRIGRKKSVLGGMLVSLLAQTVLLFVPNLLVRSICFFVMGVANLKNSQSYVWSSECVPFSRKAHAFTVINVFDASPPLLTGLWYIFIGRDWFLVYAITVVMGYSALFLGFICPESPRWLLLNGRQKEAIDALNKIARWNRTDARIPTDA